MAWKRSRVQVPYGPQLIYIFMKKRVFIIHGWDGHPEESWFPWLKKELELRDYEVIIPQLPNADEPRIKTWVGHILSLIPNPDRNTFFVGHSMGCQAIIRYLESLNNKEVIGGAIFVAGFLKRLSNLEDDDVVRSVAEEWLTAKIDFNKVKTHLNKSFAIFSDNDMYVPLDNQDVFKDELGSKIIIEKDKGHFNSETKIFDLPSALKSLLEISQ